MAEPAESDTQNLLPVQAYFSVDGEFQTFIGQGQPFYATVDPDQSGLHITNSTIDSTTIGATTPSTGVFSNVATTTGTIATAPSANTDIVNKQYVDAVAQGLNPKQSVKCATTANIMLSGLQTVDTYTTLAGDRVLVKNQSTDSQNGIYIAGAGAWTRSTDMNVWSEVPGAYTVILNGSANVNTGWVSNSADTGTINVTAITFVQFSGTGTYYAGTGLSLAANTFSITNTGVTAATKGSASKTVTATVNAQGQLTSLTDQDIAIANTQVSGLGTMSTQNAGAVAITGGTIDGTTIGGTTAGAVTGTTITANTQFTGSGAGLTGTAASLSIGGNAATATSAGSATTATTATNLAGGSAGTVPYQASSGSTSMLVVGTNGQVLTLAAGLPSWATPTVGTVTSVSGTGTVSGISLSGTVTSSGNLTLGGTLDLSSPPAIGGTTPNTAKFTTGLVGSNANFTDFPNAQFIGSQANTGSAHIYNIGVVGEGVATDIVGAGQWGVGVYGTGATAGATRGIGVVGDGHCGNTADTAAAIGVRGYATQSHSGGQNIGLYAQATGGASNYALFMASGNIYSAVDQTWAINDNSATALSIDATGKAGILKVNTSNGAEGISTSGSLVVTNAFGVGASPSYGSIGQVLTSAGSSSAPTWTTPASAVTVSDDTSTATTRYPLFADATSGSASTIYTSSTKYQYVPSTGILTATGFAGSGAGITGTATSLSIGGNAATATSATTATNLAGGAAGSLPYQASSGSTTLLAAGSNGQILTLASGVPSWAAAPVTGITITDDTTTNATRYLAFTSATSGSVTGQNVSSTKLQYNPSTGTLSSTNVTASGTVTGALVNATNGIVINSQTVAASYSIPSGSSAMSAGPITVASGQSVTVASGSRWVVL
jgi:hypothetical protein